MSSHPLRRMLTAAVAAAVIATVVAQASSGAGAASTARRCGLTTLQGTIRFQSGSLRCGPAQAVRLRADLHPASTSATGTPLASFAVLTDFQLADEESPLRGEFLDKCGDVPTKAAARWNDTLLPALIDSQVEAVNQIAAGPVTGRPFDFAVQLGDATDNQQYNETRAFIDLLDGGTVNPGSGATGYEGNQGADPYASPVSGARLRDLANLPFWAEGLRRPDGSPLPWYSIAGNHDVKVRGTVPNDNDAWRTFARAWVTGSLMVNDLPPDQQQRVCADPSLLLNPQFWMQLAAQPNTVRLVSADPNRRLLDRNQWVVEHLRTRGLPKGHGVAGPGRCTAASGAPLDRACYSFDLPPSTPGEPAVHFIGLDSAADEGLDTGNIDQAEWNWLNEDLKAHSASYYTSDDGSTLAKTGHAASLIVVFAHHTLATMTNDAPRADRASVYGGDKLTKLLLRFPSVVAMADGHTHENKVMPHARPGGGGFWEINTSSLADFPHQGRTIELVDNHDGTISVVAVAFDAAAPVDPHAMSWAADATPETAGMFGGGARNVNEDMLASIGRWVGANDPQSGAATVAAVSPLDVNVLLSLKDPAPWTRVSKGQVVIRLPRPPRIVPRFPFHGFAFPFRPGSPPASVAPSVPFTLQPAQQYQAFGFTERGLGLPARSVPRPVHQWLEGFFAALIAVWLIGGRVRRRMVGL